jgi:hypothetical protein
VIIALCVARWLSVSFPPGAFSSKQYIWPLRTAIISGTPATTPSSCARRRVGVRFGRPSVLTPHQRTEVLARLAEGDSCADAARSYSVDRSTITRLKPKPETAAA